MIDTDTCRSEEEYFDLEFLKDSKINIDKVVQYVIYQNPRVKQFEIRNGALKQFNNVTLDLVKNYKYMAESHIKHLLANKQEYGVLYRIAESKKFNSVYVEYSMFPLIDPMEKRQIMKEVDDIAKDFFKPYSLMYNITCLEILYFFALLVNPDSNWITMDYISNGNKNHQYVVSSREHFLVTPETWL